MPKVYVVNRSAHDFSEAERFGELIFVTEGLVNKFETTQMHRYAMAAFKDSSPKDYIVPCALNILNIVICAVFANMHGRLNLLLFKPEGTYLEKNLVL